jgi:hypothetical protein
VSSAVADIKSYKSGKFYSDKFRGDNSWNGNEHNVLLKNLQNGQYVDVGFALGVDDIRDGRGVAVADFGNNGRIDIVVNNNPGIREEIAPVLYRNDIGQWRKWLEVELVGTLANRDAAGSEVRIELPDKRKMFRHVTLGSGYASQSMKRLHFGIGDANHIAKLTIKWLGPGGGEDVFENVPANQILRIIQGQKGKPATIETAPVQGAVKTARLGGTTPDEPEMKGRLGADKPGSIIATFPAKE